MTLLELSTLFTTFFFGSLAIYLSFLEEKSKKLLKFHQEDERHKLYQIAILKDIQDRISYSLDIEKVATVITGSLRNLLSYATASSVLIKEDKLIFHSVVEEPVSHEFLEKVRQSMIFSLSTILDKPLSLPIEENVTGIAFNDTNPLRPSSFFHIPLIVNDKVVGLITVASTKPNTYKEQETTILYQIVGQASHALSRLQEVLVSEKGKLEAMIKSLNDGVFMVDVHKKLTVINSAAKQFLSISKENPTMIDVLSLFPNTVDLASKIEESITKSSPIRVKEIILGQRVVELLITPVFQSSTSEAKSQVLGATVILHDITLEKDVENVREDFTNMVVHELRAPLTAVKGAAKLMAQNPEILQKEEGQKLLRLVDEQSERLLDEVSSLLDAAKLQAGKLKVQKSPNDLTKLIQEKVEIYLPQAKAKNVMIQTDIPQNLTLINFDPFYIRKIINNLLSNSLKFTSDGGKIIVKAIQQSNNITISVSDTGIGIPKEQQEQLFSRFGQLNKQSGQGTGLGLYIAKGIIEAHGGTIWIDSPARLASESVAGREQGPGTTISFTLPVEPKSEQSFTPRSLGEVGPLPSAIFKTVIN